MMRRRVVITGMGAVTPLGHSVKEMFEAQLAGRSGVGSIAQFNARRFPTTFAAEVKDYNPARFVPHAGEWLKYCGLNTRFASGASQQAIKDAGLLDNDHIDRTRFGVYLGCGEGSQDFWNFIPLLARAYTREKRVIDEAHFERDALNDLAYRT